MMIRLIVFFIFFHNVYSKKDVFSNLEHGAKTNFIENPKPVFLAVPAEKKNSAIAFTVQDLERLRSRFIQLDINDINADYVPRNLILSITGEYDSHEYKTTITTQLFFTVDELNSSHTKRTDLFSLISQKFKARSNAVYLSEIGKYAGEVFAWVRLVSLSMRNISFDSDDNIIMTVGPTRLGDFESIVPVDLELNDNTILLVKIEDITPEDRTANEEASPATEPPAPAETPTSPDNALFEALKKIDAPEGESVPVAFNVYLPVHARDKPLKWLLAKLLLFYPKEEFENLSKTVYPKLVLGLRNKLYNRLKHQKELNDVPDWFKKLFHLATEWFHGSFSYDTVNLSGDHPLINVRSHAVHNVPSDFNFEEHTHALTHDDKTFFSVDFADIEDYSKFENDFVIPKFGSLFETSDAANIHNVIGSIERLTGYKFNCSLRYLTKHNDADAWFVYSTEMFLDKEELEVIGNNARVTKEVLDLIQKKIRYRADSVADIAGASLWFVNVTNIATHWLSGDYTESEIYYDENNKLASVVLENITPRQVENFNTIKSYVREYYNKDGLVASFTLDYQPNANLESKFTIEQTDFNFDLTSLAFIKSPEPVDQAPLIINYREEKKHEEVKDQAEEPEPEKVEEHPQTTEPPKEKEPEPPGEELLQEEVPEVDPDKLPKLTPPENVSKPIESLEIRGFTEGVTIAKGKEIMSLPLIEEILNALPSTEVEFVLNLDSIQLNTPVGKLWVKALTEVGYINDESEVKDFLSKHKFSNEETLYLLKKIYGDLAKDTYPTSSAFYESSNVPQDVVYSGDVDRIKDVYKVNVGVDITKIPPLIKSTPPNFPVPNLIFSLTTRDLVARLKRMLLVWLDKNKEEESAEKDAKLAVLCSTSAIFVQQWAFIQIDLGYETSTADSGWQLLHSTLSTLPKKFASSPSFRICRKYIAGAGSILSRASRGIVIDREPKSLIGSFGNALGISMGDPVNVANTLQVYLGWLLKNNVKATEHTGLAFCGILHVLNAFNKCFSLENNTDYQIYTCNLLTMNTTEILNHLADNRSHFNSLPFTNETCVAESTIIETVLDTYLFPLVSTSGNDMLISASNRNLEETETKEEKESEENNVEAPPQYEEAVGAEPSGQVGGANARDVNTAFTKNEGYPWVDEFPNPNFLEEFHTHHYSQPDHYDKLYNRIRFSDREKLVPLRVQFRVLPVDSEDPLVTLNTLIHLHPKEIEFITKNNSHTLWNILKRRFKKRLAQYQKLFSYENLNNSTRNINGELITPLEMIYGAKDTGLYEWLLNALEPVNLDGYYFQSSATELPHILPSNWFDRVKANGLIVQLIDPCQHHYNHDVDSTHSYDSTLMEHDKSSLYDLL